MACVPAVLHSGRGSISPLGLCDILMHSYVESALDCVLTRKKNVTYYIKLKFGLAKFYPSTNA